jgi:PAS domain S-box-containing protein
MAAVSAPAAGGAKLFTSCFKQSRNAMFLLDDERAIVDVNAAALQLLGYRRNELIGRRVWELVVGGPLLTPREWEGKLREGDFTGSAEVRAADGHSVGIQFAATVEVVTGRRLVLYVALNVSRWGARFRREPIAQTGRSLSHRELEIIRLVAMGSTGKEIADELHIAHDTVRTHVRNAMTKSGARSRAHLVAKALGEGLALEIPQR